ncbi:centrosomal protein of 89 kDa-like isoform X1 [Ptychodera flava]|uniref:centrosomal protein of 89 kDa-like isoform X1 n=1 Tax=Ptychodera flava TaxID=63121 RepID=UPI00396A3071
MAGKSKKNKKDKLNKTWPRIGSALFPRPMIVAAPQTQKAVPESPKTLRKPRSPLATALLTASLGGRVVGSPGDFGTFRRRHSDSGPSRSMLDSGPGSLAASEVYDYDQMEETAGYSTIGSLTGGRQSGPADTLSSRPKLQTPSESETESEEEEEEEEESPRSPYYFDEKAAEAIYAQPDKSKKLGRERPSSVTSDLTVVSSPIDDYSDLAAPPPPWERKKNRYDYESPSPSVRKSRSSDNHQQIVEEPVVQRVSQDVHAGSSANPRLDELDQPGKRKSDTTHNSNGVYDHLQRTRDKVKEYELTKMENIDLRDELRAVRQEKEKVEDDLKMLMSGQEDATRSKVQVLEQKCQALEVQKQAVMEVNNQLHSENTSLKKLAASLKEDGAGASALALKQQIQDISEENETLKSTVHRLNVELSRYQAKYRPPEKGDPPGMPSIGPTPTWLTNTKYLAPLFLAYDDRLGEKDDLIQAYEDELEQFKTRVEEVIEENSELHMKVEQTGAQEFITPTEWHQLKEQAKLVLEENQLLMEQLDIQQNKHKEALKHQLYEVSKISKKLILCESEKSSVEADLSELKHKHSVLKQKYESSLMEGDHKISLQDHYSTVADLKKAVEDLKEKNAQDLENVMMKLQAIQKEKKSLGLQLTDSKAENKKLEGEIKAMQRAIKKSQQQIVQMQKELEFSENKGAAANHHLNSVLKVAEKTVQERDHYYKAAKKEALEKEKAVNKIMEGSVTIGKMEEKLKMYKMKAEEKYGSFALKMQEKEEDHSSKLQEYERQIRLLQVLVKEKQEALDTLAQEKRSVENELETVWQSATEDNRRMQATLAKSLRKNDKVLINGAMYRAKSDEQIHISSESDN